MLAREVRMESCWIRLLIIVIGFAACASARAEELRPDQDVLRAIAALPPNHGLALGRARIVGDFNDTARRFGLHRTGPRNRDYSLKMVWAPERQRVLFAGANHGSPHRLNDVWEFDLAAMSWVLLYAPDNPRGYTDLGPDWSDVEFLDGVLITRRGGPAVVGHSWSGITYDPVRQQMLFMSTWVTDRDAAIKKLGGDPSRRYTGAPLWAFSPVSGQWTAIKTPPPYPRAPYGALLEYVPELGGALWHMNNWQMQATWLFQGDRNRWTDLKANGSTTSFASHAPSRELVGYHDPKREMLIVRQGNGTFHFDTRSAVWTKQGETDAVPEGYDGYNVFYYDPASGHGLLLDFRSNGLWSYDPDNGAWRKINPDGDQMPVGERMLGYMDHARNVLVVIDDDRVWAFRYAVP